MRVSRFDLDKKYIELCKSNESTTELLIRTLLDEMLDTERKEKRVITSIDISNANYEMIFTAQKESLWKQ